MSVFQAQPLRLAGAVDADGTLCCPASPPSSSFVWLDGLLYSGSPRWERLCIPGAGGLRRGVTPAGDAGASFHAFGWALGARQNARAGSPIHLVARPARSCGGVHQDMPDLPTRQSLPSPTGRPPLPSASADAQWTVALGASA